LGWAVVVPRSLDGCVENGCASGHSVPLRNC
jgi:hypothetical protein